MKRGEKKKLRKYIEVAILLVSSKKYQQNKLNNTNKKYYDHLSGLYWPLKINQSLIIFRQ